MLNFNTAMTQLILEMGRVLPEFQTIRLPQLRVSATFNSSNRRAGVLAYVLPLKYRDGSPVQVKVRGTRAYHYAMVPQYDEPGGPEILYIIYFMLPRFFHLSLRDKLETVVHELYHVHPTFNGDLRRFKGRSELHGSLKAYDKKVRALTEEFLSLPHDRSTYQFLLGRYSDLERRFGGVEASKVPEPKPRLLKVVEKTGNVRKWDPLPEIEPLQISLPGFP